MHTVFAKYLKTCIASLAAFLISQPIPAIATQDNNAKADHLLSMLARGESKTPEQSQTLIRQVSRLIDEDDRTRQQALALASCWHQKSIDKQQIQQTIEQAETQIKRFATSSANAITVELEICKAQHQQYLGPIAPLISRLDRLIKQAYTLKTPLLVARGRTVRGSLLSYQGNFNAALEDLTRAQNLFSSLDQPHWADITLGYIAASYRRFGDASAALKHQLKLEKRYLAQQKTHLANDLNIQIASSYEQLGKKDQALTRYRRSQVFLADKKPIIAADMSVSMAGILLEQGKPSQALNQLLQAQQHIPKQYSAPYSYLHLYLARTHFALNNYADALTALEHASHTFGQDKNQRGLVQALKLKSDIHSAAQDWQLAHRALSQYFIEQQKLNNDAKQERVIEIQTRFDTDKIERENALLIQMAKDNQQQLETLQRNENLKHIIILLIAFILITVSLFAYRQFKSKRRFKTMAMTDELTMLANRRAIHQRGSELLIWAKNENRPLSLIAFDADYFKLVNDTFGHEVGDKVLQAIAAITKSCLRKGDIAGRIGGEEFLIVLPNCDLQSACDIANRLLKNCEQFDWPEIASPLTQTVSAGVASYDGTQLSFSELLLSADRALYRSKNRGRNCVSIAGESATSYP